MDEAHEWTEQEIERLTRDLEREYNQAAKEMRDKLSKMLADFDEENGKWKERLASGSATQKEYEAWLETKATDKEFVSSMADTLAQDAVNADKRAMELVNNAIPTVYAENANRAAFEIDSKLGQDHSFDLYDQSTVRRLIANPESDLLPIQQPPIPNPKIDARKDKPWNKRKFNSAITQSILQGESIPNTAKRLQTVLKMDENAAVRAARTAMTGAENAGRVDSYRRAKAIGIDLEQEWMATLDMRTRHSHRELDGQHVPVGEKFKVDGVELEFPADPTAPPEYVYNCRCTLVAWFPDLDEDERWSKLPSGITYDEWKRGKKLEQKEYQYTSGSSQIWGQLGDNDPVAVRKKVDQMLQGSAGNASRVWKKYESQLKLFDPDGTKGDFFDAFRGVSVNLANDIDGNGVQGNVLGTFFHEFGHHIDHIVGDGWGISNVYGRNSDEHFLFQDTLRKEVSGIFDRKKKEIAKRLDSAISDFDINELVNIGAVSKTMQSSLVYEAEYYTSMLGDDYVDLIDEDLGLSLSSMSIGDRRKALHDYFVEKGLSISMPDDKEIGYQLGLDVTHGGHDMQIALGDIYEGGSNGLIFDTFGHGGSYWGDGSRGRLAMEAFAEFFSAECIYSENPKVLDIMKEYLPESYSVYREIMESIL